MGAAAAKPKQTILASSRIDHIRLDRRPVLVIYALHQRQRTTSSATAAAHPSKTNTQKLAKVYYRPADKTRQDKTRRHSRDTKNSLEVPREYSQRRGAVRAPQARRTVGRGRREVVAGRPERHVPHGTTVSVRQISKIRGIGGRSTVVAFGAKFTVGRRDNSMQGYFRRGDDCWGFRSFGVFLAREGFFMVN